MFGIFLHEIDCNKLNEWRINWNIKHSFNQLGNNLLLGLFFEFVISISRSFECRLGVVLTVHWQCTCASLCNWDNTYLFLGCRGHCALGTASATPPHREARRGTQDKQKHLASQACSQQFCSEGPYSFKEAGMGCYKLQEIEIQDTNNFKFLGIFR